MKASPACVSKTKGAIGYVEYAYALQNKMTYAKMENARRQVRRRRTTAAFQAAAANADWAKAAGHGMILTDAAGRQSWPITGATFILMYKQPGGCREPARQC